MKLFAISIIILIIIKEGVSEWTSNSTLTWNEAQLYCSDSNSSLIQGHSQHARGEYWTGEYKRLSSWMHIIGCYSWNYLSENTDVQRTLSLSTPSLGICQELCLPVNVFAFSIKTNKCLCLGKIPERNGLSPQTCDGKCHESCPNDCGSSSDQNIFNVYTTSQNTMTMSDKYDVKKLCLSLYSTDFLDTYYFRPDSCASASRGLCQRSDNKDELFKMNDYTNWENALKACKRNGSYLFGNITSRADAGNKINGSNVKDKTTFWHWLGIARKIYLTTDTGIPTNTRLVIKCKMYDGLLGNFVDDCDSQGRKLQAVCRGDKPKLMTIQKVNITSEYKMTWIEANHFCKSKNSTMIQRKIDNMTSDYWRGEYNRLSDWIHIIGCYNWSYLRYHTDPSTLMTLPRSSLGLCQELCQPLTTFAFSIKSKECVCLRHIPEDSGLSPHFCDGRCETYQQHFQTFHTVPNDCGSTYDSSIFNVYTSSPRTVTQHDRYNSSMLCLRLFCMDTLNVCHLVPSKCSNPFWNRICENNADNYALRNIATWETSVEICRNNGSYLYGNMTSSSQAIQAMKKFHLMKINNQFWLGAARQVYPTVDRGQHIETKEIVRCNLCTINKIGNGNKCDYDTDCNSRDTTAFAVCEDNIHKTKVIEYTVSTRMASLNSPIPAKGTDQINTAMTSKPQQKSSRRVTPNNIHNLIISRKPVPQTKENDNDNILMLEIIPLSLLGFAIVLVTIAVFCVRRRKEMKAEIDGSRNDSTQYTSSHTDSEPFMSVITRKLGLKNDSSHWNDNFSDASSVVTVLNFVKK